LTRSPAGEERARLGRQALKRPLSEAEMRLAGALEQIFRSGIADFAEVAARLQRDGIPAPSGAAAVWTPALLQSELNRINVSLDAAYASGGRGG
jgi:Recombinase-like helix-turn-helix domain